MHTWLIVLEENEKVIFADKFVGVGTYISGLLRIARFANEHLENPLIRVLNPGMKGVLGDYEWEKQDSLKIITNQDIIALAKSAEHAGINYE